MAHAGRASRLSLFALAALACSPAPAPEAPSTPAPPIRFATFNVALHRQHAGQLAEDLQGGDAQARALASIIRTVRPDVLLLAEIDDDSISAQRFATAYLEAPRDGPPPLTYPHRFVPPSNTGIPTGLDLDRDGRSDGPGDAKGFGRYRGQYGMALLSRFPIARTQCFGDRPWASFSWAQLPDDPATPQPHDWYDAQAREVLPLSSKNHCDVLIETPHGPVHVLISHPTPPVFDGPEDRNGHRNRDEILLWRHHIDALPDDARFVILGDLNADPHDAEASAPIAELLAHPRVRDPKPRSIGAARASQEQAGANTAHRGDPHHDTADFDDRHAGNLRVDYALPSDDLHVKGMGVFWPSEGEPGAPWVDASDHRLVWVDVSAP